MSIWKSPVFYFGVALLMVVALALVAPFIINWNAWKPEMEAYGRRLTGREVVIAGPVDVRLFPWPRLTARSVTLANAEEFSAAPLLVADAMTTRFSLAGLASATLQVEEIEFESPQLNLVRNADGRMNWNLVPDRALDGLLSRVKLDRISIVRGGVWFEDRRRQQSHSLTGITAKLSAQALEGPWRLNGSASWRDTALGLSVTTAAYDPAEGLRFAITATPEDNERPILSLDGTWSGDRVKGNIRLAGQDAGEGKGSIQDKLRPLVLQSAYDYAADTLRFDGIRITPADKKDSGTLIEGEAAVNFGQETRAKFSLKAPRVNLDSILGAGSMARWRLGGPLAVANSLFAEMPANALAEFALDVNVITANGETLNDVNIKGVAEPRVIRITNASANLPGRTRAKFTGAIFPADGAGDLGGALALESNDLRGFTSWLLPQVKPRLEQWWEGSRGRVKLEGKLNWSGQRLALQDVAYELDGLPGKLGASLTFGEVPQALLTLDAKSIDLDTYLQRKRDGAGWSLGQVTSLLPLALDMGQAIEHRLLLSADTLKLNGISISGVDVDYSAGLSGLEIKAFNFGLGGGATLTGQGLVINGTDGPVGEIELGLQAADVMGFLQLAGLADKAPVRALQPGLGQTDAKLALAIEAKDGEPAMRLSGTGTSGGLTLRSDAVLTNLDAKDGPALEGSMTYDITDATPLFAALLPQGASLGKASGRLALSGTAGGYAADVTASLVQSGLSYKGKLAPSASFWGLDGVLALEAASAKAWGAALAAPLTLEDDAELAWQGNVTSNDAGLTLAQGDKDGGSFALNASLGAGRVVSADIETGALDLRNVLAMALQAWRGVETGAADGFAAPTDFPLEGDLFVRPRVLRVGVGPDVPEAVIGLSLRKDGRDLSLKSPGKALDIDLSLVPQGAGFALTGKGRVSLDLAKVTTLVDGTSAASGTMLVEGSFEGQGRSPAAVLQALAGKGDFWMEPATLNGIRADGYGKALAAVQSPTDLTRLLESVTLPPGTALPAQTGAVTIASGVASTAPITFRSDNETLVVEPSLDLSTRELSLKATLHSRARADLPPLIYSYAGETGSMKLRKGTAALAGKLGYDLMSAEMARLEALQQQEQELLDREEEQRREDQQRYDAFQSQRAELRQRLRELRFHKAERKRRAEEQALALAKALKEGDAINRAELARRSRELAIRRKLALPFVQP